MGRMMWWPLLHARLGQGATCVLEAHGTQPLGPSALERSLAQDFTKSTLRQEINVVVIRHFRRTVALSHGFLGPAETLSSKHDETADP